MPVEVTHVLRRAALSGPISTDLARLAHADLLQLPVHLLPCVPHGRAGVGLRRLVTACSGWYVALAADADALW